GYLGEEQGEPKAVADAIRDHYKPVGQGDEVPTAPVTVAVALADKLDTLVGFFLIQERPTGSKDPYALRRAAIGCISLLLSGSGRSTLLDIFECHLDALERDIVKTRKRQQETAAKLAGVPLG